MSVSLLHRLLGCNLGSFELIGGGGVERLLFAPHNQPLSPSPSWATGLPRLSGELSCPPGPSEAAPGIHSRQQQVQRKDHNLYIRVFSNSSTLFLSIVKSLRGILPKPFSHHIHYCERAVWCSGKQLGRNQFHIS